MTYWLCRMTQRESLKGKDFTEAAPMPEGNPISLMFEMASHSYKYVAQFAKDGLFVISVLLHFFLFLVWFFITIRPPPLVLSVFRLTWFHL
jgi:hypothetical protein